MPIAIVGGGIGGMAAALALARVGRFVLVLEQAPAFGEVGAGVQLGPNAVKVLRLWGLEEAARAVAFAPEAAEVRDAATGRVRVRVPLGEDAERRWGAPYLQMHRADLHAILTEAALATGRVEVRAGFALTEFEQTRAAVMIGGAKGELLTASALIGCDGVRSTVRHLLFGRGRERFSGQTAWRALVPAGDLPAGLVPPVAQVWAGPHAHAVHYYVRGGELVNLVAVTQGPLFSTESWSEPGDRAELAAAFQGWPTQVRTLIDAAPSVMRWALHDRAPLARWSRGRVSLAGDAAHPMLPYLAQGAAMAIEDAQSLAAHLGRDEQVPPALAAYEAERRPRTARVQAWSRRNATLFHLAEPFSSAAFGAAAIADRVTSGGAAARFDWLYGYCRTPDA